MLNRSIKIHLTNKEVLMFQQTLKQLKHQWQPMSAELIDKLEQALRKLCKA